MTVFLGESCTNSKKDQLYAYLEENGIIAKLTEIYDKILTANVKPENPLDFIREELGDKPISAETIENMEHELDGAHREIEHLRNVLKRLGVHDVNESCDSGPEEFENGGLCLAPETEVEN